VTVTKSKADKAGDRLRKGLQVVPFDVQAMVPHYMTLCDWRAQHAEVLTKTVVGLRSAVQTSCSLQPHGRVFSRLKREAQIMEKLVREKTRLSSMTDIAGCRAVLPSEDHVYRVLDQIQAKARKLEVLRVRDYINDEEHETGYQAVHVLGLRDDYRVEIQLRTVEWHDWALRVERYDRQTGEDAKHGRADQSALDVIRDIRPAIH